MPKIPDFFRLFPFYSEKNWKKSSISSNCFNPPLIVSFRPLLSRFWCPENDTISGVDSSYTILHVIVFSSQISSQITDFFRSQKYFFLRHANFWFVPYRSRDNFPKNDDLFPIGAFPIRAEDCIQGRKIKVLKITCFSGIMFLNNRNRINVSIDFWHKYVITKFNYFRLIKLKKKTDCLNFISLSGLEASET